LHLGEIAGGRVALQFGAGWSGNHLFSSVGGIFGIGHLLWQKPIDGEDLFVISLDYNGVRTYLPDVPLPGFELIHRMDDHSWLQIGLPRSAVNWEPLPGFTIEAAYEVPFTVDVTLAYELGAGWSVFGRGANFFNGYRLGGEPMTNHVFFQMARTAVGVRYVNPHLVFDWAYFDFSVSGGYAFEQRLSTGYDIRDMERLARLADAPFIGLLVRGRF
jgi:hypothetical protein